MSWGKPRFEGGEEGALRSCHNTSGVGGILSSRVCELDMFDSIPFSLECFFISFSHFLVLKLVEGKSTSSKAREFGQSAL
jgi:hypothetical protein